MSTLHIDIPYEFIELCEQWHFGQGCLLYAVASSGGLYLGNRRPTGCDTDEKWYLRLWLDLSADLSAAARVAKRASGEIPPDMQDFEEFVSKTIERLREEYGLQDWEGE